MGFWQSGGGNGVVTEPKHPTHPRVKVKIRIETEIGIENEAWNSYTHI